MNLSKKGARSSALAVSAITLVISNPLELPLAAVRAVMSLPLLVPSLPVHVHRLCRVPHKAYKRDGGFQPRVRPGYVPRCWRFPDLEP